MYGNPHDEYLNDLSEEFEELSDDEREQVIAKGLRNAAYTTKDSGKRAEHSDGVVRDTNDGKPRFDLMFPRGVPYDQQLMTRVAELYARGGVKYGDRNWEKSETEETLAHHEAAFMRHATKFLCGVEDGEDHAAAIVWNVNAVDLTRRKLAEKPKADPPWTPPDDSGTTPCAATAEVTQDHDPDCQFHPTLADLRVARAEYIRKLEETPPVSDEDILLKLASTGAGATRWTGNQRERLKLPLVNAAYLMDPRNWEPTEFSDPMDDPNHLVNQVLIGTLKVEDIDWVEGTQLTEVSSDSHTWVYSSHTDTWTYQSSTVSHHVDDARSFKKIRESFYPLKVTSGTYQGLIFTKEGLSYEPE